MATTTPDAGFRPHIAVLALAWMAASAAAGAATLESDQAVSKEGYYQLRWDAAGPVRLVEATDPDFRDAKLLYVGSDSARVMSGQLTPQMLMTMHDADGNRLANAMEAAGFDPMGALDARRSPETMRAFIELHVEQGPALERLRKPIGVVDGFSGEFKWIIHLKGKADHAGTSPMNMRSDAFMGLADFAHEIPRIVDENGTERSRLTIGKVELKPGNPHTIPGEVIFTLVGRDNSEEVMYELGDACRRARSAIARRHKLMFEYEQVSWLEPVACSTEMIALLEAQARRAGVDFERMPSGAGHDTQFMAGITPAGMLFVPSVGGVSHAPDEWTHWSDIELGSNLLLAAALELAR